MVNKIMIKLIGMIACSLVVFSMSGCWSAREINDLEIVIGIGIDENKEANDILLTAQIVKSGEMRNPSPENESSGNQAYWNVHSTGESIFDAVRNITYQTGNRLFVSHSQVLIFSKEIAARGMDKYMDFFLRTHEMRPSTMIFIAESNAAEVLAKKPEKEKLPAMNISKLITASGFTSQTKKINLQEFSSRMMSKTAAPIAPLIKQTKTDGIESIYISGMAVFKRYSMVGTLNEEEARGYLWVAGEVKSGIIHVPVPSRNGIATLEINKAKSKVTPKLIDDKILMHIEIKEEASMTEQSAHESLATVKAFEMMEKEQAEIIKQDIIKAFEKSQELNCDIFGFGELIHKKYRTEWKRMEGDWDEIYQSIELVFDIETKIRKTELITKPVFSKEE